MRVSEIYIGPNTPTLLQYESLRSHVLKRSVAGPNHGLALFIHQGMMSWVEVFHKYAPANFTPDKKTEAAVMPPHETSSEMIRVLANITLFCLNEH